MGCQSTLLLYFWLIHCSSASSPVSRKVKGGDTASSSEPRCFQHLRDLAKRQSRPCLCGVPSALKWRLSSCTGHSKLSVNQPLYFRPASILATPCWLPILQHHQPACCCPTYTHASFYSGACPTLLLQTTCLPLWFRLGAISSKMAALAFFPFPPTGWVRYSFWQFCYFLEMSLSCIWHAGVTMYLCGCHPYQVVSYFMLRTKSSITPMASYSRLKHF